MSVKTDPASAEIPSAEVFVPAAILDPDFPGLRAAPGQPLSCVQSVLSGQPDPSGSSVPCAQSVPCDQSVPGDISVASGQPVTPGLPAVSVRPVSPAQGAIAGRPAVSGYGAVCTDGAGPSGSLPSVAGVPPSFGAFALAVYPFLELQPFHRAYYRVLEAFAAGRIRRLIVTMPPQHGKSVGATTLLPAYVLGLDPDCRVAIASYSGTLASKFNRRVQRIQNGGRAAKVHVCRKKSNMVIGNLAQAAVLRDLSRRAPFAGVAVCVVPAINDLVKVDAFLLSHVAPPF